MNFQDFNSEDKITLLIQLVHHIDNWKVISKDISAPICKETIYLPYWLTSKLGHPSSMSNTKKIYIEHTIIVNDLKITEYEW